MKVRVEDDAGKTLTLYEGVSDLTEEEVDESEIRVGAYYRCRNGQIVGPVLAQTHSSEWPAFIEGVGSFMWNGRFNGDIDDPKDLIELVSRWGKVSARKALEAALKSYATDQSDDEPKIVHLTNAEHVLMSLQLQGFKIVPFGKEDGGSPIAGGLPPTSHPVIAAAAKVVTAARNWKYGADDLGSVRSSEHYDLLSALRELDATYTRHAH